MWGGRWGIVVLWEEGGGWIGSGVSQDALLQGEQKGELETGKGIGMCVCVCVGRDRSDEERLEEKEKK